MAGWGWMGTGAAAWPWGWDTHTGMCWWLGWGAAGNRVQFDRTRGHSLKLCQGRFGLGISRNFSLAEVANPGIWSSWAAQRGNGCRAGLGRP